MHETQVAGQAWQWSTCLNYPCGHEVTQVDCDNKYPVEHVPQVEADEHVAHPLAQGVQTPLLL